LALQQPTKAEQQYVMMAKKRYYPEPVLNYARDLLRSAVTNAIVITNGDVDTYSTLCVQQAESLRRDVSVVCLSTLGNPRIVKCLRDSLHYPISLSDYDLENSLTQYWRNNSAQPRDVVLRNMIGNAVAENRPVYFAFPFSFDDLKEYAANLTLEGLLFRYTPGMASAAADYSRIEANLQGKCDIKDIDSQIAWKADLSPMTNDPNAFYRIYASLCRIIANHYLEIQQKGKAVSYFEKALDIYDAIGDKSMIVETIDIWLKKSPGDSNAERLRARYVT
jgi:hypothetical protein